MPNKNFNDLTIATTTDGTELVPVVSSGVTSVISVSNINSGIIADTISDVTNADDLSVGQSSIAAGVSSLVSSITQQDLTGVNTIGLHRSPNSIVAMFVYDTSKDSDGGAWTEKCQHTSWYNEPLSGKWLGISVGTSLALCETAARAISGATTGDYYQASFDGKFYSLNSGSGYTEVFRGNKRSFPKISAIIVESSNVTIYDLTESGRPMWMRFVQTSYGYAWTGHTSTFALNGMMAIGVGSGTGLLITDFVKDAGRYYALSNTSNMRLNIAQRNIAQTSFNLISTTGILNSTVNAVAMTILRDAPIDLVTGLQIPTIAVATAYGASVIRHDGTIARPYTDSLLNSYDVAFGSKNELIFNIGENGKNYRVSYSPFTTYTSYSNSPITPISAIYPISPTVNYVNKKRNSLIKSNDARKGLYVFRDNAKGTNSSAANIANYYNTGYMVGDVRRAYLSDIDAGIATASELVTNGDFSNGMSAWTSIGYNIVGGVAKADGITNTPILSQSIGISAGKTYMVTFTASGRTSGNSYIILGGTQPIGTLNITQSKTYNVIINTSAIYSNIGFATPSGTYDGSIDNVSVKEVISDRSYNAQGASIIGTLTKTAVANASQLVAYSGFSINNYLRESYSTDLDFGTGEWSVGSWMNISTSNASAGTILSRAYSSGPYITLGIDATSKIVATVSDGTTTRTVTTDATYNTGTWIKAEVTYKSGKLAILVNGVEVKSTIAAPLLTLSSKYNLLTYTEQFDDASWGKGSASITSNAEVSPDGTTTADLLTPTSSDSNIQRDFTPIGVTPYVFSVWLKSATGTDISTQLVCSRSTPYTVVQTQPITVTTAWQRFTMSFTTLDTSTHNFAIGRASSLQTGENIYIWGAQLETGSTSKSYQRVGAVTDFDFQAPLTIGNSYDTTVPFPGSLSLVKLSATVPTAEHALWMYNQEKQMFQPNAQVTLPDVNAIQDLSYDDLTDTWVAASTINTSYWNGLVRTNSVAVPAGTYSRLVSGSGMHLSARITTNPGVDITIPDYKVRTKIKKKSEKSKKNSTAVFDYTPVQFTNATLTNGSSTMVCSTVSGTPYIGMTISGTGITPGTTILGINGTSYYLSTTYSGTTGSTYTVGQTSFDLPVGYTSNLVYSNGAIKREGSTKDWTRVFDGFKETVIFGTSPGNVSVQIHCQTI